MNLRFFITVMLVLLLACQAVAQDPSPQPGSRGRGGLSGGRGGQSVSSILGSSSSRPVVDPLSFLEPVEARFREIDEDELKNPPQRDYKVEVSPLKKRKLFRADPKLLENKYIVGLILRQRDHSTLERFGVLENDSMPKEIRELIALDSRGRLDSNMGGPQRLSDIFRLLTERCQQEDRSQAAAAYLTSPEFDREHQFNFNQSMNFTLYAPTQKDAEERAAAIIRLYDCGAARPLQRYFLAEGRKRLAAAHTMCEQYEALSAQIIDQEKKLAVPSEVSPEILSDLKAQRVMVAVELAGLNARVKACDTMLNEPQKFPPSALQSISDMKVKAEIERIGTQEKLDRINAFIAEGDKRDAIQKQIETLKSQQATLARTASFRIREADHHARMVAYFAPRELEGNAITISPVEWTE
jgi:hypothetical protein